MLENDVEKMALAVLQPLVGGGEGEQCGGFARQRNSNVHCWSQSIQLLRL